VAAHRNDTIAVAKPIVAQGASSLDYGIMLNDRSSCLSLLRTRRSARPQSLCGPAPSEKELEQILAIAARTPDHGKLQPWRFVVVGSDQRDALAAVLRQALSEEWPGAPDARHAKEDEFAHYGGTLVVLLSAPVEGHKVPVWEQELSCGAAGMNILLAATALGYEAGWVTGWRAYSPRVASAFCLSGERIAGFIFIGHSTIALEERPRPAKDAVIRKWSPE
jgi:nitroreductase